MTSLHAVRRIIMFNVQLKVCNLGITFLLYSNISNMFPKNMFGFGPGIPNLSRRVNFWNRFLDIYFTVIYENTEFIKSSAPTKRIHK